MKAAANGTPAAVGFRDDLRPSIGDGGLDFSEAAGTQEPALLNDQRLLGRDRQTAERTPAESRCAPSGRFHWFVLPILADDAETDVYALIADVDVVRARDQAADAMLRLVAEGAAQYCLWFGGRRLLPSEHSQRSHGLPLSHSNRAGKSNALALEWQRLTGPQRPAYPPLFFAGTSARSVLFDMRTNVRSASFTAIDSGNISATSGARTTTFAPAAARDRHLGCHTPNTHADGCGHERRSQRPHVRNRRLLLAFSSHGAVG